MNRITFENPKDNETPSDIVWHNIRIADEQYNLQYFIAAARGWFHLYPQKGYQDLEKELRQKNMNTYLFAAKPGDLRIKHRLVNLQEEEKGVEYECMYSCRPPPYALKEVLRHSKSYEENLEKLAKAGHIVVDEAGSSKMMGSEKVKILSDDEKTEMQLLSENKKKLQQVQMTMDEALNHIVDNCKKKHGEEPQLALYGMGPEGQPIMAFTHKGRIISDLGLVYDAVTEKKRLIKIF